MPEDRVTDAQVPPETGVMLAVNGAGVPLVVNVIIDGANGKNHAECYLANEHSRTVARQDLFRWAYQSCMQPIQPSDSNA